MIKDLQTFLAADATLRGLMNADATNPKVFLLNESVASELTPFIRLSCSTDGTNDDVMEEMMITLSIFGESYDIVDPIKRYVDSILDVWDQIRIASANYLIFYSKKISGLDRYEQDTDTVHVARIFRMKFKTIGGG